MIWKRVIFNFTSEISLFMLISKTFLGWGVVVGFEDRRKMGAGEQEERPPKHQ